MSDREYILETLRRMGKAVAESVQARSAELTGTELNAEDDYIPSFAEAVKKNMLERKAGLTDGFVCKSSAGRIVRLIQNYDSNNYLHEDGTPLEPEELPAQWGFVWSNDPAHAKPFIALSTSPYMKGNYCLNSNNEPKRSTIDNNTYDPDVVPRFWE